MTKTPRAGHLLGQDTGYPEKYMPDLLEPIPRNLSRANLGARLPFRGVDIWTAYELSWLTSQGKPQVALAEFVFPSASPAILESKSFKYYLNSLNQHRFASRLELQQTLERDLAVASGAEVQVQLFAIDEALQSAALPGYCVDNLDATDYEYQPNAGLLCFGDSSVTGEALYSHLLKSNCPVTGQPDWASVWIRYAGCALKPESFLAYVVSFRNHQDFHENCVERMFCDLWATGKVTSLQVYARYTRRGGLDINPYRASTDLPFELPEDLAAVRVARQ